MERLPDNIVLILIDVQRGFDNPRWGQRNNPRAEAVMARLLAAWRTGHRPVFHVQHLSVMPDSPLRPENPGSAINASRSAGNLLGRITALISFMLRSPHRRTSDKW